MGALEPQFNSLLFDKLGLGDDADFKHPYDPRCYARLRTRLAAIFAVQSRPYWVSLLEGSDACFAPVLTPAESKSHPHMLARSVYGERDGVLQAAPAPRFSATPSVTPKAVPRRGEHSARLLAEAGLSESEIGQLLAGD